MCLIEYYLIYNKAFVYAHLVWEVITLIVITKKVFVIVLKNKVSSCVHRCKVPHQMDSPRGY